jgi:hypothetical protein
MTPARELEAKALTRAEQAIALKITDQPSYDLAAERLLDVAALRREIEQHHSPLKKSTYAAWQQGIAAERRLLDPVMHAEALYKTAIAAYAAQQRRIEAEARAKPKRGVWQKDKRNQQPPVEDGTEGENRCQRR